MRLVRLLIALVLPLAASAAVRPVVPIHPALAPGRAAAVPAAAFAPAAASAASLTTLSAAPAAVSVAPAAAAVPSQFAELFQELGLQVAAINDANATVSGSLEAGRNIEAMLPGGAVIQPVSAVAHEPWVVESRDEYHFRRGALAAIAMSYGMLFSLPQAGPVLTQQILQQEVRGKRNFISDIDDTIAKYNSVLPAETAADIVAARRAGKLIAFITDRPDKVKPNSSQISALDTLSAIPEAEREGIIVATNGGGKIYRYNAAGVAEQIYTEPGLPEEQTPLIQQAAAKVKARLAALGTGVHLEKDGKEAGGMGPYGYSIIMTGGTPESTVKKVAQLFQDEMKALGVDYHVEGRMAKDPALPPYVTFSKLNKSLAVRRLQEQMKLKTEETLLIGDSMYAPKDGGDGSAKARAAAKLGEQLAGRAIPATGNGTDRNMELGMPGALTLSVGGTADPTMSNAWVLFGKGPDVTRMVLQAMAAGR